MKKYLFLTIVLLMILPIVQAQVAINTDGSMPNSSAMLDVKSDTAGILIPRMTAFQRDNINNPATGLMVYVTDDHTFYFYTGTAWEKVGRGASGWVVSGNHVYVTGDSVGIGTVTPSAPLEVAGRISQIGTGRSVFLGEGAGEKDDHSYNWNIFIGYEAGKNNTSGIYNTAIGYQSLYKNTIKGDNTALGVQTLYNNTSGHGNLAASVGALYNNTTGNGNTALGYLSLFSNTTGHSNVAVGVCALYHNTNRNNIVAIGDSALFNNGTGASQPYHSITNTAVGSKAMYTNTTGYDNTTVGFNSMYYNTTGYENAAFGQSALQKNTIGFWNTAIGFRSLFENVVGNKNTALGFRAGYNATGSGNVFIGWKAGYNETGNNKLYIANSETGNPLIGGDFNAGRVDINGTIKITGGSPGQGKVLSSDTSGNASWVDGATVNGGGWTVNGSYIYDTSRTVGIGTHTPDASAALDVSSNTKGFLPPRMSYTEMNAIASPPAGLMVYNTTINSLCYYDGSLWNSVKNRDGESDGDVTYGGQTYHTVIIGTQIWMKENLNIGIMIDSTLDQTDNDTIEKYCYRNSEDSCNVYGGLYSWWEMMQYTWDEGTQGICPAGWHLPTDAEWKTLEMYLGMSQASADSVFWRGTDEGGKLKETGTTHWSSPNIGATNSSGFTALPGGIRYHDTKFHGIRGRGYWWTSNYHFYGSWWRQLIYDHSNVDREYIYSRDYGMSVRCLKN